MNGCVEPIYRNGKFRGERHRFDNALSMRVLRQLDKVAESKAPAARLLQALANDFEAFLDVICTDDDEQFDTFLRSHDPTRQRDGAKTPNLSTLPILPGTGIDARSHPPDVIFELPGAVRTRQWTAEAGGGGPARRTESSDTESNERKSPNLSTLPGGREPDPDKPPIPSAVPAEAPVCKSANVSTLPAARLGMSRRPTPSSSFAIPTQRRTGTRHLTPSPRLLAPADHFAAGMKLYRVRAFFPPGREERGFSNAPLCADRPITSLRRRPYR